MWWPSEGCRGPWAHSPQKGSGFFLACLQALESIEEGRTLLDLPSLSPESSKTSPKGILNFPILGGCCSLPWFPRWGSEAQRARQPAPGSKVGRSKFGERVVSPHVPLAPQVEGCGREDLYRRNNWGVGEKPPASPTHPLGRPQSSICSPRPNPRTQTRSALSSTWMRPWCTALSRWALPSSSQPWVSEGPALVWEGGLGRAPPSSSHSFPP